MAYTIGQIIDGQITGIQAYGAFVQVDENTTGLIHISELSEGFVKDVSLFVKVGDHLKLKILDIDAKTHQLRLSLKALHPTSRKTRPRSRPLYKPKTPLGFSTLAQAMPHWINEAKKEPNHD